MTGDMNCSIHILKIKRELYSTFRPINDMEKLAARTDKHTAANMRIGNMAGLTNMLLGGCNAIGLLFGRKEIILGILPLPKTIYLYRALVAGQTQL